MDDSYVDAGHKRTRNSIYNPLNLMKLPNPGPVDAVSMLSDRNLKYVNKGTKPP